MNHKSSLRIFLYCLVALMLAVNTTGVAASSQGAVLQSGKVFTVKPSGGDDTANIQHAFDQAVAAGPGSTVKLAAGNFRTRFIEVWNFEGAFKGAGQNESVIDTFANQDCQALVDNNRQPALFNFFHGNVRVSDLGFHITPVTPCQPFLYGGFEPGYIASWINPLAITPSPFIPAIDCAAIQKERVSASITRLTFQGEQGIPQNGETWPVSNIGVAIQMGGSFSTQDQSDTDCIFFIKYAQGNFTITNTNIQNVGIGIDFWYSYNSPVLISDNTFDLGINGMIIGDNSGSKVEISANHLKRAAWDGIWVWHGGDARQPYIVTPAVYNIHDNQIQAFETRDWTTTGIIAWDTDHLGMNYIIPPTDKTMVLFIHNNRVTLTPLNPPEEQTTWGVWLEGVDDSLVANNKISGTGTNAIYAGSFGPSRRDMLLGNNLTGFSSNASSPYKIVLETGTEKYVVIGEPAANVANYGTDNLIAGGRFQTPRKSGPAMKQGFGRMKGLKLHSGQ